ncbi:MAG: O-antigen ligase family protein [Aliarcobacter sp.]|nr:O-antigen ligase family protein [Aliarcobacter sp.]
METIREIKSEFVKPLIWFLLIYFLISLSDKQNMNKLFFLLGCVLIFHTILNIAIWIDNGGWPSRTGGLLDGTIVALNISAVGERFGIWATYALSFALSMTFSKYKKFAYLFIIIALISIIANHTRATFIGTILIFLVYFIFLYKNKIIKVLSLSLIILSILFFSIYSKNFGERFNIYNMVTSLKYLNDYTPSQFKILEDNYGLGYSTVTRLAMWKSVIVYRIEEPFIPQSYGRFLYGKSLSEIYKDKIENIPYVVFPQAHSDFMSMLFSLGIFGLIFFLLLLGYTLKVSYALTKDENYKSFGVLVFLGTFGYIGSMMFGSFFGDTEQIFFYILLGATLAIYVRYLNEHKIN